MTPLAHKTMAVFNRVPNQQWEHRTGTDYTVVVIANLHSTDHDRFPLMVTYRDTVHGYVWSRPVEDFIKSCRPTEFSAELETAILELKYAFMEDETIVSS